MNKLHILLSVAVLAGGFGLWQHSSNSTAEDLQSGPEANAYGFVPIPSFEGQDPGIVYVVAAKNCPEAAAQRADRLAQSLARKDIPVKRINHISFHWEPPQGWIPKTFASREEAERWNEENEDRLQQLQTQIGATQEKLTTLLQGPLPLVVIGAAAKNNPTMNEVLGEYGKTR